MNGTIEWKMVIEALVFNCGLSIVEEKFVVGREKNRNCFLTIIHIYKREGSLMTKR